MPLMLLLPVTFGETELKVIKNIEFKSKMLMLG
jgi:hypothetical protein